MTGTVTHFEIFADDAERLAAFYQEVFGWRIERAPGVDYWRVQTDGANGLRGGLLPRPMPGPESWLHYVHVPSVDASIASVKKLGGKIIREKSAVPKTAWYAILEDPDGNKFGVWQQDAKAMPIPVPD
jgi:predicted enzyme related to lactoylglutathione lyase